jgi:hypothetical protein
VGNSFAHGVSAKEAYQEASKKHLDNLPTEEKIKMFTENFSNEVSYKAILFYDWHTTLTGSCKFGKDAFIQQHNIDLEYNMTVDEFIEIVSNEYGKEIIGALKKHYE